MKRIRWSVALVALGITVASVSLWSYDNGRHLPASVCDLADTWVGSSPAIPGVASVPILSTKSVTATHPSGRQFTAVIQPVNVGTMTAFGPFPDADHTSDCVGTYLRTGPRTYQFTWVAYFWTTPEGPPDRGLILYFWVYNGTLEFLDANTTKLSGNLSFYSNVDRGEGLHDQDTDDDGFADDGEVPFACFPWEWTFKRLPVLAPCTPAAP